MKDTELLEKLLNYNDNVLDDFKEYILNNKRVTQDTKNRFIVLFSNDYLLQDLNRDDINCIKTMFDLLELKVIEELGDSDPEIYLNLQLIRRNLMLNLLRARVEKPNKDFFDILNLSLKER
jgi:hypothetical protein